jgi:restriction system protein
LPSGRQTRFANRVGWARTYLRKAGLLDYPSRGTFRITELGRAALAENPSAITIAYLSKYAGFNEFKRAGTTGGNPIGETADALTPVEALEAGYQQLRASLAGELLDQVKSRSPDFFENLVVDLLVRMGYGGSRKEAGERIGKSGDGGVDGIIKEDKLGLDVVYIQAKRWDGPVGRSTVQAFAGSLEGHRARKGVMITTSRYTNEAIEYVKNIEKRIVLIDGEQLVQYMIDHNVGVADVASYSVKRIALEDLDYFDDVGVTT